MLLIPVIAIASPRAPNTRAQSPRARNTSLQLNCLVVSLGTLYFFSLFTIYSYKNSKARSFEPGSTFCGLQRSAFMYSTVPGGMDISLPFRKIQVFDWTRNFWLRAGGPGLPVWRRQTKNPAIACGVCVLSLCSSIYWIVKHAPRAEFQPIRLNPFSFVICDRWRRILYFF